MPPDRKNEFSELLTAEALITLHVFGNATAFLLTPHLTEVSVVVGDVEEVLTDNGQLALHGRCGSWTAISPLWPGMMRG